MKISTKSDTVTIRLLPTQLKELDELASKYGQTKSDLIREAIQVWLGTQWQKEKVNKTDAMA